MMDKEPTLDMALEYANENLTNSGVDEFWMATHLDAYATECVDAERERVAERLQILFEDVVNGSSPVTLLHGVMLTALIDELRGGK